LKCPEWNSILSENGKVGLEEIAPDDLAEDRHYLIFACLAELTVSISSAMTKA
jgi:hypothetical protein